MTEGGGKRCRVAVDAPGGPLLIELELPAAANIAEALAQARRLLQRSATPATGADAAIDWDAGATGIWGQRRERTAVPRDGDRVELYRALSADPRQQRRTRARKGAR